MKEFTPDKTKFKDSVGNYITQSLFLEVGYDTEKAVYTLADTDKEYKGVIYPSLRRLYLEEADPTEYHFSVKYLWGWEHWQKICGNKMLLAEIEKWRSELEVKLRAIGVRDIIAQSGTTMTAAKWVADGQWRANTGRKGKTKAQKAQEAAEERSKRERIVEEAQADAARVVHMIRR